MPSLSACPPESSAIAVAGSRGSRLERGAGILNQLNWMAWQEILAQVFDGFELEVDIAPEWMINPATGRRLKLDRLYPEIGLAMRFVGGQPRSMRRRPSDWELLEQEQRDQTRVALCQAVGVTLLLVDPNDPEPRRVLTRLSTALSGASRRLAQSERPKRVKARLMPQLASARQRCSDVHSRLRGPRDMALFAELWRDREVREVEETRREARGRRPASKPRSYREGQMVQHTVYGLGTVVGLEARNGDIEVTVRFSIDSERTFLASLVRDKLLPQR